MDELEKKAGDLVRKYVKNDDVDSAYLVGEPANLKKDVKLAFQEVFAAGEKSGAGKVIKFVRTEFGKVNQDDEGLFVVHKFELNEILHEAARSISGEI